jgi:hypothetical protein
MKISFSFKREPVWMLVLSFLAPVAAGLFVFVVLLIVRSLS